MPCLSHAALLAKKSYAGDGERRGSLNFDPPEGHVGHITAATYMLMRTDAPPADNAAVLKFLSCGALRHGQDQAKALDYVPMPDGVVVQIEQSWPRTSRRQTARPCGRWGHLIVSLVGRGR